MSKTFRGMDPKVKERGPKKERRKVDKQATKRAVLKHRSCFCGGTIKGCDGKAATGHHVLSKGSPHFGDDVVENIVGASGSGTSGCHGLIENEDMTARRKLGEHLILDRPDVIFYVKEKLGDVAGDDWLARRLFIR